MTVVAIVLGIYLLRIDQQTFDVQEFYVLQRLVFLQRKSLIYSTIIYIYRTGSFFYIVLAQDFVVLSAFDLFISARALFMWVKCTLLKLLCTIADQQQINALILPAQHKSDLYSFM